MKKLDGTKNGQLGASIISFPAYKENEETGEVIEHNTIRGAVEETLEKLEKTGTVVFNTAESGAVILKAYGKDVANLKIIQYNRSYEKLK